MRRDEYGIPDILPYLLRKRGFRLYKALERGTDDPDVAFRLVCEALDRTEGKARPGAAPASRNRRTTYFVRDNRPSSASRDSAAPEGSDCRVPPAARPGATDLPQASPATDGPIPGMRWNEFEGL